MEWMRNNVITGRPAQHVPNFVKTHRESPFQRRHHWLLSVPAFPRPRPAAEHRDIRQWDEELYALGGRRQRRDAVRAVLAERRVDLHEEIEERRRNSLQRSVNTKTLTSVNRVCPITDTENRVKVGLYQTSTCIFYFFKNPAAARFVGVNPARARAKFASLKPLIRI